MIQHVVVDAGAFRCLRCGDRHQPRLPMPCEVHASACRGFALMHKHCLKPAEPSKQVQLFDALVLEEAQASARLDGETFVLDELAPGEEPRGFSPKTDRFAELYPMARDHEKLRADLAVVLQNAGGGPTREQLEACTRMGSERPLFDEIAHWTRVELAHMNATEHSDWELPSRLPMPRALRKLLPKPVPKRTRSRKAKT